MKIDDSRQIIQQAIEEFNPTHIVSMVSGGKDSAASDMIARELNIPIDLVIHGNTRTGIPETTQFVLDHYPDVEVADAGTAYEDYVLRKGFFGQGIAAHGYSYRILKAQPFRKLVSRLIRKGKHNVRILFLNGARKDESENRKKHLQVTRRDPAAPNNIWVNIIHNWDQQDRDSYLESRSVPINPVAKALCRSGECMCGTMQTQAERLEAKILYPHWGQWLDKLEKEVLEKHGFGWGQTFPKKRSECLIDFQPMCKDCLNKEI